MTNEEQNGSSPELSPKAEKSEAPITPMGATLPLDVVSHLPELSLESYAKTVRAIAADVEIYTKIPSLVPIAQSAHESRNGNSGLSRNHCNLFGIVATDSWKKAGNSVAAMPTFEFVNGHKVDTTREFRAYKTWRDSFFDWARILTELSIYKHALALLRDPSSTSAGIIEMGKIYATDPKYAKSVQATYDKLKLGGF